MYFCDKFSTFCNKLFTLIFETFRSSNSFCHFVLLHFSFTLSIESIDLIIILYSPKYLQPFYIFSSSFITKCIKISPVVPITKEQREQKKKQCTFLLYFNDIPLACTCPTNWKHFSHGHL